MNSNKNQCVSYVKSHWQFSKNITFKGISKLSIMSFMGRLPKVNELKRNLKQQQNMFIRINNQSEGAVQASFIIAEQIARACRPFTEGEFIKNCIDKVGNVVCPEKKQAFADISLSPWLVGLMSWPPTYRSS